MFLQVNGLLLTATEAEAVAMFEGLAAGTVGESELTVWFEKNTDRR